MTLVSWISYGTDRYPARVARRLRVLNVTAWLTAAFAFSFALNDISDPKRWILGATNVTACLFTATIPFWHRLGELAAPIAYVVGTYTIISLECVMLGTGTGMQMQYAAIAAGMILVLGPARRVLIVAIGGIAIALIVIVEITVPHSTGLFSPDVMFASFVASIIGTCAILLGVVYYAVSEIARAEAAADHEFERAEALLGNILPAAIVKRLKTGTEPIIADAYDEASILFVDLVGSTALTGSVSAVEMVTFLDRLFSTFDGLVDQHGLEKIKTTGDGYMVVSGVPLRRPDHAQALASLSLAMRDAAALLVDPLGHPVAIRIGLACGPVMAGVLGVRKFSYDVWGDAVNVASRMEATGVPSQIHVSREIHARLQPTFDLEARGAVEVKGKGAMQTWFLLGPRRKHVAAFDIGKAILSG